MNKILHGIALILLISSIILLEQQMKMEVNTKSNSSKQWEDVLVPLWQDSDSLSLRLGPILVALLSILCVFGLLRYYYETEEQILEY